MKLKSIDLQITRSIDYTEIDYTDQVIIRSVDYTEIDYTDYTDLVITRSRDLYYYILRPQAHTTLPSACI